MSITSGTITVEDIGNSTKIIHISGQLDESNVDEKIQEIYKSLETSPKGTNLIFDLENLEYMNSKSIGYLTDIYGKVTESGGKLVIAKARPNILDILQVVGLTQLIQAFETTEEAKTSLIQQSPQATPVAQSPAAPVQETAIASPPPATVEASVPAPAPTPTPIVAATPAVPSTPTVQPTAFVEPTVVVQPAPVQTIEVTPTTVAEIAPVNLNVTPTPVATVAQPTEPMAQPTPIPQQTTDEGGVYKFEQ